MNVHDLPTLNASLNATAALLLLWGRVLIKRGHRQAHQKVMIAAFGVSVIFLVCYLIYHAQVGSVPYPGHGAWKALYLFILIPHIILAATVPVLALRALYLGVKQEYEKHKKVTRWAWPIWMYVSVTGVIVYLMLYVLPHGA